MLPNQKITNILNFYDILGYFSGWSVPSKTGILPYIISMVHILLVICFTFVEIHLIPILSVLYEETEIINQVLQYSTTLMTYFSTVFDSFLHRKTHKLFWNTFQRIDQQFCCQSNFTIKLYMIKCCEFFLVTIFTTIVMFISFDYSMLRIEIAYNFQVLVCQFRVFYYLLCLEVVHFQLQIIESELKIIQNSSNPSSTLESHTPYDFISTKFRSFEMDRFKWIRGYAECVNEMCDLVNQFFGWSHAATILFCVYLLLTDLNWFYMNYSECDWIARIGRISSPLTPSIIGSKLLVFQNAFYRYISLDISFAVAVFLSF